MDACWCGRILDEKDHAFRRTGADAADVPFLGKEIKEERMQIWLFQSQRKGEWVVFFFALRIKLQIDNQRLCGRGALVP